MRSVEAQIPEIQLINPCSLQNYLAHAKNKLLFAEKTACGLVNNYEFLGLTLLVMINHRQGETF